MKRTPHKNEVDVLFATDGKTVFSIRKREDENFEFYIESLSLDEEEEVEYWTQNMSPERGVFGSVDDAKLQIFTQFSHIQISN